MDKLSPMYPADIEINKLPSVPSVLLRLIEACHKPDISFDDISRIIQQDPALSARIIAIGNSAAYAQWNDRRNFKLLLISRVGSPDLMGGFQFGEIVMMRKFLLLITVR